MPCLLTYIRGFIYGWDYKNHYRYYSCLRQQCELLFPLNINNILIDCIKSVEVLYPNFSHYSSFVDNEINVGACDFN